MGFGDELARFEEKSDKRVKKVVRLSAITIFTKIIKATPVGNADYWKGKAPAGYTGGSLRGSWFLSFRGVTKKTAKAGRKNSAIPKMTKAIAKSDSKRFVLSNILPYAKRVEYGWSKQAPEGMVRLNVRKWKSIVRRVNTKVKRKIK